MKRTLPAAFYPQLESLRGFASLSVVLGHCYLWGMPPGSPRTFEPLFAVLDVIFDPQPAVLLFFVLSGFVLGGALSRTPMSLPGYIGFMLRRIFRIVPILWVSLAFAVAAAYLSVATGARPQTTFDLVIGSFSGAVFLQNFNVNPVTWSLYIEMIGSALIPVLFIVITRTGPVANLTILTVFFLMSAVISTPLVTQFLVFFYAGLLIGYTPDRQMNVWTSTAAATAAFALYIAAPEFFERSWTVYQWKNWQWIEAAACPLIVYLIATGQPRVLVGALNKKTMLTLGRLSFGIYLLHFPIVIFSYYAINQALVALGGSISGPQTFFALALIVVPTSIALSAFTYRFIEHPLIEMGRDLAYFVSNLRLKAA